MERFGSELRWLNGRCKAELDAKSQRLGGLVQNLARA